MLKRRPILVIEDNDDDFKFLDICLHNSGVSNQLIRCITGEDVTEFLEHATTGVTADRPIFVFLDLNLPGTQGSEVLKLFKAHPTLSSIPVVVLTTSSHQRDIDECYRLGAAGFLTKPLDFDKFEQMVRHVAEYWFACVKLPDNAGLTAT